MRRIFSLLSLFGLLFVFLFLHTKHSDAAFSCKFNFDANSLKSGSKTVILTSIDSQGNLTGNSVYTVYITGPSLCFHNTCPNRTVQTNGSGNISNVTFQQSFADNTTYTVGVAPNGSQYPFNNTLCSQTFKISAAGGTGGGGCIAYVSSDDLSGNLGRDEDHLRYTPNNKISLSVTHVTGDTGKEIRVQVKLNDPNGTVISDKKTVIVNGSLSLVNNDGTLSPINLGSFSSGSYYVQVNNGYQSFGIGEAMACYTNFRISPTGCNSTADCDANNNDGSTVGPPPVCANSTNGKCNEITTGLGNIGTNPDSFVKSIFGIILSIAGGIAVLLIIIAGYRIIAAQGNPEKIVAAREQLFAAIVGLLFLIFSLFILQVIGVDILNLPGFGK